MTFLICTLTPLFLSSLVAGNFSYDGNTGPSHWGNEYKTCMGKFQSPIDIEEKDVTTATFPTLLYAGVQSSHTAYMTNNGHTVMVQSFDDDLPTISGGPLNNTFVFQQLHFHWGQNDNLGSEDLINNQSYSMELHAVFWKKEYGSPEEAMKHDDGLTVLGYLYKATDNPNPIFESIVQQLPDIVAVGSNVTLNNTSLLGKLIAPDIASAQNYFTYKGSLTTPPCLEIVQWVDFIQPQYISHEQLAAFRSIQSADGTNLTHNFRPVQPLDGRIVYRNVPEETTETTTITGSTGTTGTTGATESTTTITPQTTMPTSTVTVTTTITPPVTTVPPVTTTVPPVTTTAKPAKAAEPIDHTITTTVAPDNNGKGGQQSMWIVSPFTLILGLIFLLPYQ